jgi:hypothetical protein
VNNGADFGLELFHSLGNPAARLVGQAERQRYGPLPQVGPGGKHGLAMLQTLHLELLYKSIFDEIPGNYHFIGGLPEPTVVSGYHACSFEKTDGIPGLFKGD